MLTSKIPLTVNAIESFVAKNYTSIPDKSTCIINETRYEIESKLQKANGGTLYCKCPDGGMTAIQIIIIPLYMNDTLKFYHPDYPVLSCIVKSDDTIEINKNPAPTTESEEDKKLKEIKHCLIQTEYALDCKINNANSEIVKITAKRDVYNDLKEDIQVMLNKLKQ